MEILELVDVPLWLLLAGTLFTIYYIYMTWHFDIFKKAGIPYKKPIPFFGTMLDFFRKGIYEFEPEDARKYGGMFGGFMGRIPCLSVSDPAILQQIFVKQFSSFRDQVFPNKDRILSKSLLTLKGQRWRDVRKILSSTMTPSKLKLIMPQMNKCCRRLENVLETKTASGEPFDVKQVFGDFTTDVIASCCFGLEIDNQNYSNNVFVHNLKKFLDINMVGFGMILTILFPFLVHLMLLLPADFSMFDQNAIRFITEIVEKTIARRKEKGENRVDLLQQLADAEEDPDEDAKQEGGKTKIRLTHEELVAMAFVVFLAGYDTTSSTATFCLYNLALHPWCQEKLFREIQETLKGQEDLDLSTIGKISYLQMCQQESQRLHTAAPRLLRQCTEDCLLDGKPVYKDTIIIAMPHVIHRDPKYYPEPDKYIPERFTPQNVAARDPFTFLPFGHGPRHCAGMRLASIILDAALITAIRKFRFVRCSKTSVPLEMKKEKFAEPKGGIWLTVEKR